MDHSRLQLPLESRLAAANFLALESQKRTLVILFISRRLISYHNLVFLGLHWFIRQRTPST